MQTVVDAHSAPLYSLEYTLKDSGCQAAKQIVSSLHLTCLSVSIKQQLTHRLKPGFRVPLYSYVALPNISHSA
ncbi:hypothetical protein ABVT39_015031 [Epinephelus coioides]